ncbi:MAG TPA: ATP-dependent DNA ligase [Solirubrobacterales bacterium]|nr:ATP-dependent DNA ligase [Solirubrobacterales bacterium]
MTLPLAPPIKPQLALTRKELPLGEEWAYEQKLDGFRAIVFVDGKSTYIQSRGGKELNRYFPELSFPAGRYVLDGELVIRDADGNLEFDALQSRIHPAASRIKLLAAEIPAGYVAFDLLAEGDESLLETPFGERRGRLERMSPAFSAMEMEKAGLTGGQLGLSTLSLDPQQGEQWLRRTEGTMAKQLDAPYVPGKRKGMAKVKREREIDCVVMGWRPGKEEGTVGSLILGLYDGEELRSVGHISGFSAETKRSLRTLLEPLETGESGTAEPSRWTGGRDLEWVALRPELVIEVGYDHAAAGRIRHGARFRRFRDDKDPRECRFESLDEG